MEKRALLQQWQHYNPLDKQYLDTALPDKSNKYPYCKDDKTTTVEDLLKPKISSVGVIPTRETTDVDNLGVMVIGKSSFDIEKMTQEQYEEAPVLPEYVAGGKFEQSSKPKRQKMPAIIASVGTTTKVNFCNRKKPKRMPMTKLKGRIQQKPSLGFPVPPNSRNSKRTPSARSLNFEVLSQPSEIDAPPSSPLTERPEIKIEVTDERNVKSARSVDEIIKTLRSSREGKETKSSSDIKIDELMKQVMHHTEEWSKKEEPDGEAVKAGEEVTARTEPKEARRASVVDLEEEVDVSDTVSTLASQISAPAGIPDVAAILLRKSSETARRPGGDSDYSGLTTPVIGAGDSEEFVDAAQALKDLHTSLDVTNEDIICIEGKPPPKVKFEVSDDEGYFESMAPSASTSDRMLPADLTTSITTGGRIHHLCLLAADSATQFDVSPSEAALSTIMHTAGKHRPVLAAQERRHGQGITPPPPPPSEVLLSRGGTSYADASEHDYLASTLPSVLEEVEKYNEEPEEVVTVPTIVSDEIELDTSKIDPLDLDAWRRLAEGTFEKADFTQQGERCIEEASIWRLMWNPAPPKMLIPPVAVKAALFPHYHGAQLAASTVDGKEDLNVMDFESDEDDESDVEKSIFNLIYLNRRHKSEEDLTAIAKKAGLSDSRPALKRADSIPNMPQDDGSGSFLVKMHADYSCAMEELRQQRLDVLGKEQQSMQLPSVPMTSGLPSQFSDHRDVAPPKQKVESTVAFVQPIPPRRKVSEAEISRQGGKDYVLRRKTRRKSMKKKDLPYIHEMRRFLTSYDPVPLKRSASLESGIPDLLIMPERPPTRRSIHRSSGEASRVRGRSLPRVLDFREFLERYDDPNIEDMREWVRDIWNEWFDEVIPPLPNEEDEWSTSSSEEDFETDAEESKTGASMPHPSSSLAEQKLPTKIPDVIAPVIVEVAFKTDDDEEYIDDDRIVREMQEEASRLTTRIAQLLPTETATLAITLTRRGALYRKLGQIKSALEDLNKAISLEPRLAAAYWHRHLIHLLQNKAHDALDDLNVLLKLDKQHVHAYRSRADVFASLGDFTMAIVNYAQAVKLNPNDEEAYFQRAQLYEKKGDMLLALEDYGSVVRINPSRTDALLRRGRYNFKQRNWHATIADFTHMIQREPHNALARTYRGRAYAAMKQYESALADLSASIHLDPLNWRAFYHRGTLLRTLAPEKSLQDFSCSLLINDTYENAMALLHRGILYTEMKRFKEAVVDFEEALRLDHGLACAHVNIGLVHHQITQNYTEAIRHFTNALTVDPTYTRAYMCRSDSYEKIRDHKKALRDVTRAIVLCPDDRHLYLRRGQLLLQLGELKLAGFCVRHIATLGEGIVSTSATQQAVVQSFLKNHDIAINGLTAACRVKPVPHMYVLLGKTLMKAKNFKEAIFNFKNALDQAGPNQPFSTTTSHTHSSHGQINSEEMAEIHFLLGQCHTQLEKHSKALYAYNNALKANPNHALAYYRRGLCRLKMDHAKGVQDLNRALALDPNLFEAYLSRAAFYGLKGRYSKAILNCNEALRLRPQSVRALLYRGALKFYIHAYELAVQDLTSAIKIERTCALAFFNRAVCFQRMKRYSEALKDYSIVLMLEESSPAKGVDVTSVAIPLRLRVYVNRGLLYLRDLDDAHNAALDLERVTEIQPQNIKILHTMAMCYHKLKMLEEAIESYSRCLEVNPFFLDGYVGRGDAYADADDKTSSRRDYQRALKLDPSCVAARVNLGYSLQAIGKFHQAWMQFSRAIELDAKCQQAFEGRAVTSLHAGSIEGAFHDVMAAFRAGQPTARLHATRGVIQQYMGDVKSAMSDYQSAVRLDNKYAAAYFNAASLYLRDRRFREALAYLDHAVQLVPDDDAAIINRGITRVLLNDTEKALEDFNQAVGINPRSAHTFYNRGNLLTMLKRYSEAESDYTMAFTINPSDYGALKKRADIRGKLGNKIEAIADYKAALKLHERTKRLANAA